MFHATFNLKGRPEIWFITKKKEEEITRQEAADTWNDKMMENTEISYSPIWACDIENLTPVEGEENIKNHFKEISNDLKLFM
jgi:hypothetical protein